MSPPYSNPLSMGTAYRTWHKAREAALTPGQVASPLARRPYDLRHACLSTWLNAGVPATQVAEWAGHSVNVLLKVYAKCLDGQDEAAKRRIEHALALH
jgi:integrase